MKRPEVDIFIYMFAAIIWLLLLRYLLFIFKWELLTIRKRQNASGFKTINCKQSFHNLTEGGKKKKKKKSIDNTSRSVFIPVLVLEGKSLPEVNLLVF